MCNANNSAKARKNVLTMTQTLLSSEAERTAQTVTSAMINGSLETVSKILAADWEEVDAIEIHKELLSRFIRTFGGNATLVNHENHHDWLTSDRKNDWRFWARYAEYSEQKLPPAAIDALDASTDEILKQLEDPKRGGSWDRRGMVVGHVQSGKTGNYTGLICKAADAGYKIIIVLAGLHNNLRSQTQIRLEEGFLGYNTTDSDMMPIGVGRINRDARLQVNSVTTRNDNGDFKTTMGQALAVLPDGQPWLFVVKKNVTVLKQLNNWVSRFASEDTKTVTHLPLLVIDDECDHGSVDTNEQDFDENSVPDKEHDPTKINGLIRQLLHSFSQKAYVGYTATPFANIFIHKSGDVPEYGPDLFPSAFVTSLGAPSNYIGPGKIFHSDEANSYQALIRRLDKNDPSCWLPSTHKNGDRPNGELPPSIKEAVWSFLYACAVRKIRRQGKEHSSMLIHVSRWTFTQNEVVTQVSKYVNELKYRFKTGIDLEPIESLLKSDFETRFKPDMQAISRIGSEDNVDDSVEWQELRHELTSVLSDIEVREINGSAKDALDYDNHKATGLKVIAIGGDKLSRGLTLEGLCTSYFVRTTKMYDTLMQMGRWFGYRDGYLDVCRLYLDPELLKWYSHITKASEELRQDLDQMAATGGTPANFGLRVKMHSTMAITSRAKSRHGLLLKVSFSGNLLQTTQFPIDGGVIDRNFNITEKFLESIGSSRDLNDQHYKPGRENWSGRLWRDVTADSVVSFLVAYETHKDSIRVQSGILANFVRTMAVQGELTNWTVALIGIGESETKDSTTIAGHRIVKIERTHKGEETPNTFSIGTLTSPRDQAIDLTESQYHAALALTHKTWKGDAGRGEGKEVPTKPSGVAIRHIIGNGDSEHSVKADSARGLLMLYLLDQKKARHSKLDGDTPIVACALSLPGSRTSRGATNHDYLGNSVVDLRVG